MSNKTCSQCRYKLPPNYRYLYCNKCFNIRKNDICEIIDHTGKKIITEENIGDFFDFIKNKAITVRLDLHNVLDTIDNTQIFDGVNNICCISYVGSGSLVRLAARKDITSRLGKQISFGILVFSRGGDNYHNTGSKAWINKQIPIPEGKKAIFLDDAHDHCQSTISMNIKNLDVHMFKKHENLIKIISPYSGE